MASSRLVSVRKVDQRVYLIKDRKGLSYEEQTTETVEQYNARGRRESARVWSREWRSMSPGKAGEAGGCRGSASAPGPSRTSTPDLQAVPDPSYLKCKIKSGFGSVYTVRSLSSLVTRNERPLSKTDHQRYQIRHAQGLSPGTRTNIIVKKKEVINTSADKCIRPLSVSVDIGCAAVNEIKKDAKIRQSDIFTIFERECLQAHNEYRRKHGVPKLRLTKRMCKFSEEWATHLVATGRLEPRSNSEYGENIFYLWSLDPNHIVSGSDPVDCWYKEGKKHPFGREPSTLRTGHFSQVVWRESREIGVAMKRSNSGQVYIVANYFPPGNIIENFTKNVPPVGGFINEPRSEK